MIDGLGFPDEADNALPDKVLLYGWPCRGKAGNVHWDCVAPSVEEFQRLLQKSREFRQHLLVHVACRWVIASAPVASEAPASVAHQDAIGFLPSRDECGAATPLVTRREAMPVASTSGLVIRALLCQGIGRL
jgi:hypothetical protein